MSYKYNPKTEGSGIIGCIPQSTICPNNCSDCFFQSGRSYLEPLSENLPNIPSMEQAEGRVVRINDGNDSNIDRENVEKVASQFKDCFFNTSSIENLEGYSRPVVLTINPGDMTDRDYHVLYNIPKNLMFVRIRVNLWNYGRVVIPAVDFYTRVLGIKVVLTYMVYYIEKFPNFYEDQYEWKVRTLNSYWVIKDDARRRAENFHFKDVPLVYTCGYKGTHPCKNCGNCLREYYATKERMKL